MASTTETSRSVFEYMETERERRMYSAKDALDQIDMCSQRMREAVCEKYGHEAIRFAESERIRETTGKFPIYYNVNTYKT